ncbi:MAG: hypothetical protein EP343_26935, partial [Deltaproteobacteria bacterium]
MIRILLVVGLLMLSGGGIRVSHAQNQSGVSPNVLVLPSGPGSLTGIGENVQANLNMGLMSYPIRILLPQGRNKLTPTLTVSYSSSAGAGMMGIGWSLQAGGTIERLTVRGLPTYTNTDRFYGPTGEMVQIPGTNVYRSRHEGGFVRYQWIRPSTQDQNGYWLAEYPDGSKGYFGATAQGKLDTDARVTVPQQGTFRWELKERVDRNGNRIVYSYLLQQGQTYLDRIQWVFNKAGEALYEATFVYETRPDPISDCKPGFDLQTTQRLKSLKVTAQGNQIRSFDFQYDASSGLSRLTKVTRFGRDPQKAFPVEFTMKYSDATFDAAKQTMVNLPTSVGQNFKAGNSDFIDMNGDGLPDVINTSGSTHRFHLNTITLDANGKPATHDFPTNQIVDNKNVVNARLSQASVQLLDVNGDGMTDMVDAVTRKIYLNRGNSQWENQSQTLSNFPDLQKNVDMRFFDYNGDKAIDIIVSTKDNTSYWINDGKGNWKLERGAQVIGASFSTDKLRLIDINGDNLTDAVQVFEGKIRYRKYLGYGKWSGWINLTIPGIANQPLGDKPQFADINGDGLADMVAFLGTSIVYFVNRNGREFDAGKDLKKLGGISLPDSTQNSIRILDINGNGSRDIVWITDSGKITYLELFSERPNLLKQISNGIGQRINVDYGSSVYHFLRDQTCTPKGEKGCGDPWTNKLPMAFIVVNRITTWSSRSNKPLDQATPTAEERPQIQNVYYHHGFYDGREKKFRGFRHVETLFDGDESVKPRKDEITYNVGDKDIYYHGRMLTRSISEGATKLYRKETYTWNDCTVDVGNADAAKLDPPVRSICLQSKETQHIEGETDPSKWKTTRMEMTYDGYGNMTLFANLGLTQSTGDEKYVAKDFITPADPNDSKAVWLPRAVQRLRVCDGKPDSGARCAEIQYYFDGTAFEGLPLGQLTKGNVSRIRIRQQAGQDKWVQPMVRKFDEYGNLVAYKDFSGAERQVKWDPGFSRFPVEETVTAGSIKLVSKADWDIMYGLMRQSTDQNGQTTRYTYDTFGRLLSRSLPSDPQGKPYLVYTYDLKAPISRIITQQRSKIGGELDRTNIKCLDGRGRTLAFAQALSGGKYLVMAHVDYNRLNGQAQLWQPYTASTDCAFQAPTGTPVTKKFYDGLGRMLSHEHPDQSLIRYVYSPMQRQLFDEEDNRSGSPYFNTPQTVVFDGLERTVQLINMPKLGETYITKYAYTSATANQGSLITNVTFPDGSTKATTYDLLGNVEKVVDPDRKTTLWVYNDKNQMVEMTDARGKVILKTYDPMGRLSSHETKGEPNSKVTLHYDTLQQELKTATHLMGRLAKLSFHGGSTLYSYDIRGNMVARRNLHMGVAFDFTFTYSGNNAMNGQTLASGEALQYQRDAADRVTAVPGFVKQVEYEPHGRIRSWTGSNGVKTAYTYNARLWPTQVDVGGGSVFQLNYTFDTNGNINKIDQTHGSNTYSDSYTYDAMYRLTQASLQNGQEVLTYGMNNMNNITSKESSQGAQSPVHIGAYSFAQERVHALQKAGNLQFKYDASGNATQWGQTSWTWDGQGRWTQVQRGGQTVAKAWYGAGLSRLIKEENGLHTFYVNDAFEIRDGVAVSYLKLAGDRIAAMYDPKVSAKFFDDLAPASGQGTLTPQPDGVITAGDAWLYHASKTGVLQVGLKQRPIDLNLTQDMLAASVSRMLDGEAPYKQFYHVNHLGSVRAATDEQGAVVSRVAYYPYGKVRSQEGPMPPYSYMGAELDNATQTYRFNVRSLDPVTGRWISPDPAYRTVTTTRDEFNSYGMVLNNPIRMRELGGTTARDGLFHVSDNQTHQDLFNAGVIFAGVAGTGVMAYLGATAKYVDSDGNVTRGRAKRGRLLSTLASTASMAFTGAALVVMQFQNDPAMVQAMMFTASGFTAVYQAVDLFRAYKKQKLARHGPNNRVGRFAMLSIAGAGAAGVASAVAYGMQASPIVTGAIGLGSVLLAGVSQLLMGKLDKAKAKAQSRGFTLRAQRAL